MASFFHLDAFLYLIYFFLVPLLMGLKPAVESFSPVVFLTGYRHLWYLQFIFIGSFIVYPIISHISGYYRISRIKILLCLLIIIIYEGLYYWNKHLLTSETDINLQIFASQVSRCFLYIPVAVGFGLISDKIENLFKNAFYRKVSLWLAVVAMLLHVNLSAIPATQEIYGIAVFLVTLQPWRKIKFNFWQKLIAYSYGIYILHFFLVHILWFFVVNYNPKISSKTVLCVTLVVYFLSFGAAVLIRKILPVDWLIPLVRTSSFRTAQIYTLQLSIANEK